MLDAIVVCPLKFETRRLARRLDRGSLRTIGPGPSGVADWVASAEADQLGNRLVVLAGLAGGLASGIAAGSAHVISRVRDRDGRVFTPTLTTGTPCSVTSTVEVLSTPAAKRACREATGADLVDLESVAFAEIASGRGWRWAIVRGVSDAAGETLPASGWASPTGGTRITAVLGSLARRETTISSLMTLRRNAIAALDRVADGVDGLLERAASTG